MSQTTINNSVPLEVLFNIFQYTSKSDLLQCLKVCRSWYSSAKPLYWETIQLNTINQTNAFLQYDSRDNTKFTKYIVIGCPYSSSSYPLEYVLTKEQVKQILFSLPNVENVKINRSCKLNLAELNNEDFLNEFRKNCPFIKSFRMYSEIYFNQENDYVDLLYSLRHSLTNIEILNSNTKLYKQINSFPQLEHFSHITYYSDNDTLLELLYKIKMLPYLKSFDFGMILTDGLYIDQPASFNIPNIQIKTEQDEILKQRLASLEKLYLNFRGFNILYEVNDYIRRYFSGLKDIEINYDFIPCYNGFDQWLKFICSHDLYKVNIISDHDIFRYDPHSVALLLKNNFVHLPRKNKVIKKQMQIELDGICNDAVSIYDYYNASFIIKIKSKLLDNDQVLKSSNSFFACSEEYADTIYEIFNSTLISITDIDTLVFGIDGEKYPPLKSLELISKILSIMTDSLKKVIFYIPNIFEWSKYFVDYIQLNVLSQVTHLEIFLDNRSSESINGSVLSQFTVLFPCIKYLTLQYYVETTKLNSLEYFINLPQIYLNRLTLDISIIKQQTTTSKKSSCSNEFFILKVETSKKTVEYRISLDFLNVSKITKNYDHFGFLCPKLHVVLQNIQCIEMFLYDKAEIKSRRLEWQSFVDFRTSQRKVERRIYFDNNNL